MWIFGLFYVGVGPLDEFGEGPRYLTFRVRWVGAVHIRWIGLSTYTYWG